MEITIMQLTRISKIMTNNSNNINIINYILNRHSLDIIMSIFGLILSL
jgi:hypothetical protein